MHIDQFARTPNLCAVNSKVISKFVGDAAYASNFAEPMGTALWQYA
jgi:hypothetical protein